VTFSFLLVGWRAAVAGVAASTIGALVVLFAHGAEWTGSWNAALDLVTGTLVLVGPIAAGWAALTYAGLTARRVPDFASSLVHGRRGWLTPAVMIWLLGCLVLLAAVALAAAGVALAGVPVKPSDLWILGEAFAVLAAQVLMGALIGTVVGGPWAAPIAACGVFALGPLSVTGYLPGVFDTGAATTSLVGQTWSSSVLGWQSLFALGIAVLGGAVLSTLAVPRPTMATGLIAVAGVTAAVVGWSALDSGGHARYAYESSEPVWVCRGGSPRVCLDAETPRPLAAVSAEMSRQAVALIDAGVKLPRTFDQEVPGSTPRAGSGVLFSFDNEDMKSTASPMSVAFSLATPAFCPHFSRLAPIRALRAREVLADWIGAQAAAGRGVSFGAGEKTWLASDRDAQEQWVRQTYSALADCRLDDVSVPF
jgi:hypothetical protein